ADGITNAKVADNAIQTENILDGTVATADIANDAITVIKIADDVADQVLTTDSTGNPQWEDKSNLQGPWTDDADDTPATSADGNIYNNGTVGVGDFSGGTTIDANLHVRGTGTLVRAGESAGTRLDINTTGNNTVLEQSSAVGIGSLILRTEADAAKEVELKNTGEIQAKAYGEANVDVQVTAAKQPVVGIASDNQGNFLEVPVIFAAGKAPSGGGGTHFNATVTKITTNNPAGGGGNANGDYQVTFTTALSSTNYIIQLTLQDGAGVGNDDLDISYYDQQTTGFKVNIGDNDNGGGNRADRDSEFMFTVIRIPGF
ncbi:hypothetical protein, partial [Aquimarina sp. MMG016]|uniref:hypothetical protein n=1 Tax=Aquimarina sp. MMG016 TaxID=2822690 RepID=UPI001B3A705F